MVLPLSVPMPGCSSRGRGWSARRAISSALVPLRVRLCCRMRPLLFGPADYFRKSESKYCRLEGKPKFVEIL